MYKAIIAQMISFNSYQIYYKMNQSIF